MIKKILVPTDGSENADKALRQASDLAEKYDADIELLSVAERVTIPVGMSYPVQPFKQPYLLGVRGAVAPYTVPSWVGTYSEEFRRNIERMLSEAVEEVKKETTDLEISTKIEEGKPAEKIVEVAKKGDFDMIVMGSRGLGDIGELLLGSISHVVVNKAECPVLIVK